MVWRGSRIIPVRLFPECHDYLALDYGVNVKKDINSQAILCYIGGENNKAYFTTKPISEVWGDDFGDSPYEHNSGEPYDYDFAVYFEADMQTPAEIALFNSPYSVEKINKGMIPWLSSSAYSERHDKIMGGDTFEIFCRILKQNNGRIYTEMMDCL